jgi:hypothetical protein
MRLPVKYIPQQSQRAASVVGALIFAVFGFAMLNSYLPIRAPAKGESFMQWLASDQTEFPLLLLAMAILLSGLAVLSITLIDLLSGSPFHFLIVDRFGIRLHGLFGEKSLSWKDLGPIRPFRLGPLKGSRRYWIVSDTFSGEDRNDVRRQLSSFTLRIPATPYLGRGWFSGGVAESMETAAAWLEALRKLAREEALDPENAPQAPPAFGPGLPVAPPSVATKAAPEPDLPAMADRKFGRRDGPTVER